MLLIAIIAILALYGYNRVTQPVNNTDSAPADTSIIDSTKTGSSANLVSIQKATIQWKQITTWKEKASTTINMLIICILVLLLILVYVFIKLSQIQKHVSVRVKDLLKKIEKQEYKISLLEDNITRYLEKEEIRARDEKNQEEQQKRTSNETDNKTESLSTLSSKPVIEEFTDYLSAGRSDADFFIQCDDKTGAPFCVEYHKEDRSDIGVLKLLTDINNLRTMDKGFRKNMIDIDSSNTTIVNARDYNIVSAGSVSFSVGDRVWKIKNKIKIKLIK